MSRVSSKKGWTRVAFGDVVKLVRERSSAPQEDGFERYVGLEHIEPSDLKIRRWGNTAEGTTFTNVFRAGQVLFGKRRAYQRKVAVADFDGVCSGDIYVFEPKSEQLLPDLLPFICQTDEFFQHAVGTSAGSLSPRTNWENLMTHEFDLPSRKEQLQITDLFQSSDHASDTLVDLLDAVRVAEVSLFDELVARCNPISVGLGSVLLESPRNGYSPTEASSPTGHWVLALSALTRWGYRAGELKPVEKTAPTMAAVLKQGDLLISRSNTRELVGLPAIFDEVRFDVSWPDTIMKLTPDESRLRRRFLELFLRTPQGRKQVQSFAAGTSASMKKINGTNVKKLQIPLPTAEVQDAIERLTDSFRIARGLTQKRISELSRVKRLLLKRAFAPAALELV